MAQSSSLVPDFVRHDLERLGLSLPEATLTKLAQYLDLLLETNRQFNLTAIRDRDAAWQRHVIDSLTVLPLFDGMGPGETVIDVGSGGGLPGVPIAIARPDLKVVLLETTGKKARFLEQCVSTLGLSRASVLNMRAEDAGQDRSHRERYDVAVCRAIGPMPELLEYTLPLLRVGGRLVALKGPSVEEELGRAGDAMAILGGGELEVYDAYPEAFEQHAVIVILEKDRETPAEYPRRPGVPRQEPL